MAAEVFCLASFTSRANAAEDIVALWLPFEFTSSSLPSPKDAAVVVVQVENVWHCSFAHKVTSDKDDEETDDNDGNLFGGNVTHHLEIEDADATEVAPMILLAREAKTRLCPHHANILFATQTNKKLIRWGSNTRV